MYLPKGRLYENLEFHQTNIQKHLRLFHVDLDCFYDFGSHRRKRRIGNRIPNLCVSVHSLWTVHGTGTRTFVRKKAFCSGTLSGTLFHYNRFVLSLFHHPLCPRFRWHCGDSVPIDSVLDYFRYCSVDSPPFEKTDGRRLISFLGVFAKRNPFIKFFP